MDIPYLILQENPFGPYSIFTTDIAKHLPEDGDVQNLLDHAASIIPLHLPLHMDLDESQQVVMVPKAYLLFDPIPTFIGRSKKMIAKELGAIDETFLEERTAMWPSGAALSQLGIKTEGNIGQLLVIFRLSHPRRSLASIREDDPHSNRFFREEITNAASKRESPSAGAHNSKLLATQNTNRPDAMYNGRPYELTAPPIEIFHPVFATFRRKMAQPTENFKFSATELNDVHTLIVNSLAFYESEDARNHQLGALRQLVHQQVLRSVVISNGGSKRFNPDGVAFTTCQNFPDKDDAAILFTELKNGVGDGGSDPISQSQCDYTAFYSADPRQPLRDACCCPAFLIGIAGPYMIISGAVFVDCFISQNMTDYLYLGGSPSIGPRLCEIAKVLRVLKGCLADLDEYYSELAPSVSMPPPSRRMSQHQSSRTSRSSLSKPHPSGNTSTSVIFPHLKKFSHATGGQDVELEYTERLQPQYPEKAVFKALARLSGSHETSNVVVKFTATYCEEAHDLLRKRSLAPRLWLCKKVEAVGMYVVVMDYIPGRRIGRAGLSRDETDALRAALQILHENGLVYGDLRSPNVILSPGGKAMLIDFDWSGRTGEATYPPDINMDPSIGWHADVCRGGLIHCDHDMFMLDQLGQEEADSRSHNS